MTIKEVETLAKERGFAFESTQDFLRGLGVHEYKELTSAAKRRDCDINHNVLVKRNGDREVKVICRNGVRTRWDVARIDSEGFILINCEMHLSEALNCADEYLSTK